MAPQGVVMDGVNAKVPYSNANSLFFLDYIHEYKINKIIVILNANASAFMQSFLHVFIANRG